MMIPVCLGLFRIYGVVKQTTLSKWSIAPTRSMGALLRAPGGGRRILSPAPGPHNRVSSSCVFFDTKTTPTTTKERNTDSSVIHITARFNAYV